jgi:hypothetical protein
MSQQRRQRRVYAFFVLAIGVLLLGRASWDAVQAARFAAYGVVTEARLVGITVVPEGRGRVGRYARVRYVTTDGKSIVATTEDRIVPEDHKIGDALRVSYLSSDPESVRQAAGAGTIGFWSWLILGLGTAISLAGLLWLRHLRRELPLQSR